MGLYDFLIKYNMDYETLVDMIYDLSKFIYLNAENEVRSLDCIYDDKEFKKFKKQEANND